MIGRTSTSDSVSQYLTREDIVDIKAALSTAIDEVLAYSIKEHADPIVIFITDLVMKYKLTYMLTPAIIGKLMETCFSQEPFRAATEEMAVRFYLNLPSMDLLWNKLVRTLAAACAFHNNESKTALLPDDILGNTVNFEQAEAVLKDENWLVFIAALIAYHDTTAIKAIKAKM